MNDELLYKIVEYLNPTAGERAIKQTIEAIKEEFPEYFKISNGTDTRDEYIK